MPLCGFNQKMLAGLSAFSEGLIEHGLLYRSQKNNETLNQAINRELSDMSRLLPELYRIDDSAKRIMTEGIVKYAMGFYMTMRLSGTKNIKNDYKETTQQVCNYFKKMDNKYYNELEGNSDDMKQLAQYLDGI